jgi:outer membrane protein assembly factor BamB
MRAKTVIVSSAYYSYLLLCVWVGLPRLATSQAIVYADDRILPFIASAFLIGFITWLYLVRSSKATPDGEERTRASGMGTAGKGGAEMAPPVEARAPGAPGAQPGEMPTCGVCGSPLHRPRRCRYCNKVFCLSHIKPRTHRCNEYLPQSRRKRNLSLVAVTLIAASVVVYLVFFSKGRMPSPLDVAVGTGQYSGDLPLMELEWAKGYQPSSGLYRTVSAALNVFDLDGDGDMEILMPFSKATDHLLCVNGKDGEAKWIYPPMKRDKGFGDIMGSPCIGDMDNDGKYEVLFVGRQKNMYCLDGATGVPKWVYQCDGNEEASPTLYDIDGDGRKEAIAQATQSVIVVNYKGKLVWEYRMQGYAPVCPNAFDVDQDGDVEIIAMDNALHCIGLGGVEEWSAYIMAMAAGRHIQPVIADFNHDGRYEVAVHTTDGVLHLLAANGSELWRFQAGQPGEESDWQVGWHEGGFAAGDLDGDGFLEIVTSDRQGDVQCISHDGTEMWSYRLPGTVWNGILLGDFTGDQRCDVIVAGEGDEANLAFPNGCLMVLDGATGAEEMVWPWALCASTPSAGDIDGDGKVEIIAQVWEGPFVLLASGADYDPETWLWSYKYRTPDNHAVIEIGERGDT